MVDSHTAAVACTQDLGWVLPVATPWHVLVSSPKTRPEAGIGSPQALPMWILIAIQQEVVVACIPQQVPGACVQSGKEPLCSAFKENQKQNPLTAAANETKHLAPNPQSTWVLGVLSNQPPKGHPSPRMAMEGQTLQHAQITCLQPKEQAHLFAMTSSPNEEPPGQTVLNN